MMFWTNFVKKLFLALLIISGLCYGMMSRWRDFDQPSEQIFDEVYHTPTIDLIVRDDPRAYEWWHSELTDEYGVDNYIDWLHPPLAKLIQSIGVRYYGYNTFGWRLASVICGCLLLLVVLGFARSLFPHQPLAWGIAVWLVALDGLSWSMSRLAMNDIFVTTFTLSASWAYYVSCRTDLRRHLLLAALLCGAAVASKWSGVWLLLAIGIWELGRALTRQTPWWWAFKRVAFITATVILVYLASYVQLFKYYDWAHFVQLHRQILDYQFNLDATHPYSSKAWEWPLALKPVLFYGDGDTASAWWNNPYYPTWYVTLIMSLWLVGTVVKELIDSVHQTTQGHHHCLTMTLKRNQAIIFVTLCYLCLWLPWIAAPRIMFFHHYLPASVYLSLLAGAAGNKLWQCLTAPSSFAPEKPNAN